MWLLVMVLVWGLLVSVVVYVQCLLLIILVIGVIIIEVVCSFDWLVLEVLEFWVLCMVLGYGEVDLNYGKIYFICGVDFVFGRCFMWDMGELLFRSMIFVQFCD